MPPAALDLFQVSRGYGDRLALAPLSLLLRVVFDAIALTLALAAAAAAAGGVAPSRFAPCDRG